MKRLILILLTFTSTLVKADPKTLATWEANMVSYGAKHCAFLKDKTQTPDFLLAATYYDAEWVFEHIRDYTGDPQWQSCADAARAIYRDQYITPNQGKIPGYWVFPHGLAADGDKATVNLLAQNAAYCVGTVAGDKDLPDALFTRETAYCLMTNLLAGQTARAATLKEFLLGHIKYWFGQTPSNVFKPFMCSLAAQALIMSDAASPDPQILPALQLMADGIWRDAWVESSASFKYISVSSPTEKDDPSPDLNLLIAPLYAYLFNKTGDPKYALEADKIFDGGADGAYLAGPKQFNQNYRWSFDFVKWRAASRYSVTTQSLLGKDVVTITMPR